MMHEPNTHSLPRYFIPCHRSRARMNNGRTYAHTVRRVESGRNLLDLLTAAYPHASRAEWQEHIEAGRVTVNAAIASNNLVLREGAKVLYHRLPWVEPEASVCDLAVLHDDGVLVVLNKPSGLPVLPSELYYEHTVLQCLKRMQPSESEAAPHPTHRLGVGTSGLLLCAIGNPARAALSRAFEARSVKKTYLALVHGILKRRREHADNGGGDGGESEGGDGREREGCVAGYTDDEGEGEGDGSFEIDCPIGPVPHASWAGSVHGARPEGGDGAKPARSIVRVIARRPADGDQPDRSLVEVRIPTGRAHQIRIHMVTRCTRRHLLSASASQAAPAPCFSLIELCVRVCIIPTCRRTLVTHCWAIRYTQPVADPDLRRPLAHRKPQRRRPQSTRRPLALRVPIGAPQPTAGRHCLAMVAICCTPGASSFPTRLVARCCASRRRRRQRCVHHDGTHTEISRQMSISIASSSSSASATPATRHLPQGRALERRAECPRTATADSAGETVRRVYAVGCT
jgi:23S rRNA pseudouridine1911/1915/1917 synthase